MNGAVGDGQWHCYEVHLKSGTTDGIGQMWVDGELLVDAHNIDTGTGGWSSFSFGANQNAKVNGVHYTDWDDIAISSAGRIGCFTSYHAADTDQSGCIELDELIVYMDEWKVGAVTINDIMTAITIWKNC